MAKILAVCKSKKKGTRKEDVKEGYFLRDYGMPTPIQTATGR